MPDNETITSTLVANETTALFSSSNTLIATGNREFEGMMTNPQYVFGDTLKVRLQDFAVGTRGDISTPESQEDATIDLSIQPLYTVEYQMRPTDMQREFADFSKQFLAPAVNRIAAMMNETIYNQFLNAYSFYVGDAATALNAYGSLSQVNPAFKKMGLMPSLKKYGVFSPYQMDQFLKASTLQNNTRSVVNENITLNAETAHVAGFDIMDDEVISNFTAGTHTAGGDITVDAAVSSGSTIVAAGLTPGATFKAGDLIKVAGTNPYHSILCKEMAGQMSFLVTADATAAGTGKATLSISPAINFTGPRKNIYVAVGDAEIPATSVITVVASHTPNFCYTEASLITCLPQLPQFKVGDSYATPTSDSKMRISTRATFYSKPGENKDLLRIDAQLASVVRPFSGVRLVSSVSS